MGTNCKEGRVSYWVVDLGDWGLGLGLGRTLMVMVV
jgi:hypothetical protein